MSYFKAADKLDPLKKRGEGIEITFWNLSEIKGDFMHIEFSIKNRVSHLMKKIKMNSNVYILPIFKVFWVENGRENSYNNYVKSLELQNIHAINYMLSLEKRNCAEESRVKKKIVVCVPFSVYPPVSGGQLRVFHLYKNILPNFNVDLVTITYKQSYVEIDILPGFRELRVPFRRSISTLEYACRELLDDMDIGLHDVLLSFFGERSPRYLNVLKASLEGAVAVVACHPYLMEAILKVCNGVKIYHESQDVELDLKSAIFPRNNVLTSKFLEKIAQIEKMTCELSKKIYTTSQSDATRLSDLYGISPSKFIEIRNGVDIENTPFVTRTTRILNKKKLELEPEQIVFLFIGSHHKPNIEAAREIIKIARQVKNAAFWIAGGACAAEYNTLPYNVYMLGTLSDQEKKTVLGAADFAINPMLTGTGTHLKMSEFFASGLPVISTPQGARSLGAIHNEHALISPLENFPAELRRVRSIPQEELDRITYNARALVEKFFDWRYLAQKLIPIFEEED